ncbi:MAG: preQ(1) synthase [Oligoflexia bacterium]|nr:preQ(1) synthase [Oligoflexia bacterium]MBF0367338.1 preQ(1) synthase [Oligoflexia bacterium]
MKGKSLQSLKHLGSLKTDYSFNYHPNYLEAFLNKNPKHIAWTTFVCTEFTALCPKTSQPDYAKIFINYIADKKMVESKSLKLYLMSFRQSGHFHEDCVQMICNDLVKLLKPHYIEVIGEFTPRGGISIFPYCNHSNSKREFKQLRVTRLQNYSPGKYSCDRGRVY